MKKNELKALFIESLPGFLDDFRKRVSVIDKKYNMSNFEYINFNANMLTNLVSNIVTNLAVGCISQDEKLSLFDHTRDLMINDLNKCFDKCRAEHPSLRTYK